ncbi:MAG: ATP-binding protein [Nanoarchaeota archaeon]
MNTKIREILENQNHWWFNKSFETGIIRTQYFSKIDSYMSAKEIFFLVGVRRTGKSTIMYQIIDKLLKSKVNEKNILYLNLDEPYLQSQFSDPNLITSIIEEYLVENKEIDKLYLFIDEIQVFPYWSQSLKFIYDTKSQIKIVASGSSSNLIKSDLAVKLSGRYFYTSVYPLSFNEYLYFNNLKDLKSIEIKKEFENYIKYGGFPRVVLEKNNDFKQEILKNYFQTIYMKDIIVPNKIRSNEDIYKLLYYLLSNVGKHFSFTSLSKVLNISVDTIKEYIEYMAKTYFVTILNKYDYSLKKQLVNPKKIYSIDTGVINAIAFKFSENYGRLLENLIFTQLKRQDKEIYYHNNKYECDFVIKEGLDIVSAIQVTASLESEPTKKREIEGLLDACRVYDLNTGLILTEDEEGEEMRELRLESGEKREVRIVIKPIWKWLLSETQ